MNSMLQALITAAIFVVADKTQLVNAENRQTIAPVIPESALLTTISQSKPNILLILADDVGTGDIPSWWNTTSLVDMPNINRLMSMGVKFTDAHSTPLCAPSRYMLLSGNYQHRGERPKGSWDMSETGNQFLSYQKSLAQHLKDGAGYSTSMFGKWHLGNMPRGLMNSTHILSGNNWEKPLLEGPGDIGFETSFVSLGGIQSPPYSFFRDDMLTTKPTDIVYWKEGKYKRPHGKSRIKKNEGEGDVDWDSTAYNMILVNETIRFIDNHVEQEDDDVPFFAYVALGSVHIPHSPADFYLDGSPIANQHQTRHLDMLSEMDKVVGSLVSMIEDRGLAEDTIIIFSSDNGGLRYSERFSHETSGPLRDAKASIYEGGHRIPLVMRYDKVFPGGESRDNLLGLNDMYATLSDLVGIDSASIPHGSAQDSISFADHITNENNKDGLRNELAHWEYRKKNVPIHAIRFDNFKMVHFPENGTAALYDLNDDISETRDLSDDETYRDKIEMMYLRLQDLGPCPTEGSSSKRVQLENGWNITCKWFTKKKAQKRCGQFVEASTHCGKVCRKTGWCNSYFPKLMQV